MDATDGGRRDTSLRIAQETSDHQTTTRRADGLSAFARGVRGICRMLRSVGGFAGAVEDAGGGADVHEQGGADVGVPGHGGHVGGSSFQVNRAVVQNTCRRLCQVHFLFGLLSRQPAAA